MMGPSSTTSYHRRGEARTTGARGGAFSWATLWAERTSGGEGRQTRKTPQPWNGKACGALVVRGRYPGIKVAKPSMPELFVVDARSPGRPDTSVAIDAPSAIRATPGSNSVAAVSANGATK
jgi:hypothetical protein